MSDNDRASRIAAALNGILETGDEFLVRRTAERIEVARPEPEESPPLDKAHPELYGHLLQVSEELSDAGCNLILMGVAAVAGICLAIHMQWLDSVLGIDAERLRSLWVYGFAMVVAFFFSGFVSEQMERRVYARRRGELMRTIRQAGFTARTLLARIAKQEDLKDVAGKLKTDADWSESSR